MFVLDTNILSAVMRPVVVPEIASWMATQPEDEFFTTVLSQAEILAGVGVVPAGRRRRELERSAGRMFGEFAGRILSFDAEAATAYAELFATRRASRRPAAPLDLMIASIALSRGADMVTRNVADFEGFGLTLINPWSLRN